MTQPQERHFGNTRVSNPDGLANLPDLRLPHMQEMVPVSGLAGLHELATGASGMTDIPPLAQLKNLQTLDLTESPFENLAPPLSLPRLKSLSFQQFKGSEMHDSRIQQLQQRGVRMSIKTMVVVCSRGLAA